MARSWKPLDYSEYYGENFMFDFLGDPRKLAELVKVNSARSNPEERGVVMVSALDHPISFWQWDPSNSEGLWGTPGLHALLDATDMTREMIVVFWGGPATRTFAVRLPYPEFRFGVREALEPHRRDRPVRTRRRDR